MSDEPELPVCDEEAMTYNDRILLRRSQRHSFFAKVLVSWIPEPFLQSWFLYSTRRYCFV